MQHVTIAAVHVCNVLAKRPHAVISHLNTLKEFFARNEVDTAYMDANQASFAKSATTPSTVDAQFSAEAGYLQNGSGGLLHCIAPVDKSQCTGFSINQQYLRNRLQLWSHGTWITAPSDLALRETDEAYHSPSILHFQAQGIPAGYRRRSRAAQTKRMEKQAAHTQKADSRRRGQSSDNRWGGSSHRRQPSSENRWGGSSSTAEWHRWQDRQTGASGATSSRAPRPTSSGAQVTSARWFSAYCQMPHRFWTAPMTFRSIQQPAKHCTQFRRQHMSALRRTVFKKNRQVLQLSHQEQKKCTAEADPSLSRTGNRFLLLLVLFCSFELGSAAGSPADSESSTPSHLFQETQMAPSNPPATQGATYHPMSELALLEAHMPTDPGNAVLIAERSRLMRQAWRVWNLDSSGAIPPLDDHVAFEVTLVLGLETPGTTDAPVFPYVNRQSRKRSIHSHTEEELRNNAKAAEARQRRRQIAPLGHTLERAAAVAVRRRR
eukprot:5134836-Amphidinium_carterae.1